MFGNESEKCISGFWKETSMGMQLTSVFQVSEKRRVGNVIDKCISGFWKETSMGM